MGRWVVLLSLGLVAAAPKGKGRLETDQKPVEMTSKGGLEIDLNKNIGIAKKDVVIRREDVTVCCDEAEARYAKGQVERVTCKGRVVIVRPNGTRAVADLAVFVASKDNIVLTGDARVFAKDARLSGERIVYDIGRDRLVVQGDQSRFKFSPGKSSKLPKMRACPP